MSEVRSDGSGVAAAVSAARSAGIERVHFLAWRDLDDEEAGGSELHAHRIASLWAENGLRVTMRTSRVSGLPARAKRDGYEVVRKGGRYLVFPRSAMRGIAGGIRRRDALVEIWNGMPFLSPLWARCPRVVFLHHVHAEMWRMVLPKMLASAGTRIESRFAPPLYRSTRILTLSESSREEIVGLLGMKLSQVSVVPPGVEPRFSPGGKRAPYPLVVAVGRLVPVKRFGVLIEAAATLRDRYPGLRLAIAGEGYERPALEEQVRRLDAGSWVELTGHLPDSEVVDLYRSAWVVASASQREGWGMTITEAAACGTPAVATDIAGHRDAIVHGKTGLLVDEPSAIAGALDIILGDPALRERLGRHAQANAAKLTWEATAAGALFALAAEAAKANGEPVGSGFGHRLPVAGA